MSRKVHALSIAALLLSSQSGWAECHVNIDTDSGKGGTQVESCDDHASVGFSGPVKDVDIQHPLGGHNAALPKAGRDIDDAKNTVGKGIEHLGQEIGKLFR